MTHRLVLVRQMMVCVHSCLRSCVYINTGKTPASASTTIPGDKDKYLPSSLKRQAEPVPDEDSRSNKIAKTQPSPDFSAVFSLMRQQGVNFEQFLAGMMASAASAS
jgi:hypothetical protein